MSIHSQVPAVTVTENGLQGWDEFDRWAYRNLVYWNEVTKEANDLYCMDQVDRLRYLTYIMFLREERMREERWR